MKKTFKAILTVFSAAVIALNLGPVSASAAADGTAFLAYANDDWSLQYFGDIDSADIKEGTVATDATVTGAGQYTVSIDFSGTEAGVAQGVQFMAPMIQGGQSKYPDYIIQIDSVKVNDTELELSAETYTSSDADGKDQLRCNLYNQWAGDITDEKNFPRTESGSFDNASATVIDPADFVDVKTISVTFTLVDPNAGAEEVAEEATEETTAKATTEATPKTGVVGLGLVYGLGALATGAVVLRKKEK